MATGDQRWVDRVACDVPSQILGTQGWIPVRVRDLSRTGVGIAVSPGHVGVSRHMSLGGLARQLAQVLPEQFTLDVDPERLAHLLQKTCTVIRILKWDRDRTDLMLGCTFRTALNDDEIIAIGLGIPEHGEEQADALRRLRERQRQQSRGRV